MEQDLFKKTGIFEDFEVPVVVIDGLGNIIWRNEQFRTRHPDANDGSAFADFICAHVPLRSRDLACSSLNALLTGNSRRETFEMKNSEQVEISILPLAKRVLPQDGRALMLQVAAMADAMFSRNTVINILDACDELFSLSERQVHQISDSDEAPLRLNKLSARKIVEAARRLLKYEILELRTLEEQTKELTLYASFGLSEAATQRRVFVSEDCGIIGHVAVTQQPYLCSDTSIDGHYIQGGDQARSSLTVPIFHASKLVGVLNIESSAPSAFSEEDQFILNVFAQKIGVLLHNGRLLLTAKTGGGKITASHVHGQIAPPVAELGANLGLIYDAIISSGWAVEVMNSILLPLRNSFENWKLLRSIVTGVATMFPLTDVDPRPEDVPEWHKEFQGKRILLVESDASVTQGISAIFERVGAQLAVARDRDSAINAISNSLLVGNPYYAILSATSHIEGCPSVSKFILEMGRLFKGVHPPFVFLVPCMEIGNMGGGNHALADNVARFPASTRVAKIAGKVREKELFEAIRTVVQNAPGAQVSYDTDSATFIQQRLKERSAQARKQSETPDSVGDA